MPPILQTVIEDPCGGLTAAAVLFFIGNAGVAERPRCRQVGAALGGITLLATFLFGVERGRDLWPLIVAALTWSGMMVGTAWIVLPIVTGVGQAVIDPIRAGNERRRIDAKRCEGEQMEQEQREAEYRHREEIARLAAANQPKPVSPPTTQELLAQAKQRFDARLRILEAAGLDELELAAGRARVKQQYLKEIDQVMR